MRHIRIYWYINTNTNSPTPHTHSQILRHICTPVFISLYVENTSSYWYLQFLFNTIIPQGHSSFLTFHICDLLSNSEKPVPTILICLLIWSLPVLANFLPLLPFLPLYWNQSHPAWARRPYTMPLPLSPTWWKPLLPCSWSGTCTKPTPYGSCPLFAGAQALIMGSSPCVDLRLWTPIPGWSSYEAQLTQLELWHSIQAAPHGDTLLALLGFWHLFWSHGGYSYPDMGASLFCQKGKGTPFYFCSFT